ncbi:MAG: TonB-dependent hemoglobin/transferrin/lactoferrin family receptor, partial [Pseudomonadota bacterium]
FVSDIPGVSIDGGPRSLAQEPNIRGFADNQIVLRVDGGRQNFNLGHQGRFFFDTAFLKTVEVAKGGASTLYGSGALGGVLAVETFDASDFVLDGETFGGRVTAGYQSNGDIYNLSGIGASDFGQLDLLFGYAVQDGDNIDIGGDSELELSERDTVNGLFKIGFEPTDDQRIEFSFSQYDDERTVPAAPDQLLDPAQFPSVDREGTTRDLRLSYEFNPENSSIIDLSVLVYYTDIEIDAVPTTPPSPFAPPIIPSSAETDFETLGFEVVNRSDVTLGSTPVALVYGFEYFEDQQRADYTDPFDLAGADATTIGVFVDGTFELSPVLEIVAGVRFDSYDRDPQDATLDDVEEEFFSPRLGVIYQATDEVTIYGNLSRAFRAPTISELYQDGAHFPVGLTEFNNFVPNPDLEPEVSDQVEIGMRFDGDGVFAEGDRLQFGAAAYYAEVDDFIDTFVGPDFPAFGPPVQITQARNTDATLWGLELELSYDAGSWFADLGLQIPRGEDDNGDGLGSIPQDILTATFGFRPTNELELGIDLLFAAEKDDTAPEGSPPEEAPADSYTVVDLFGSYAPSGGVLSSASIRFGVDNVFDEEYVAYPSEVPMPGRSFRASITYDF